MTQQEYINLVNEANKYSYLYYVESNPAISDSQFDSMLVKIGKYEQAHPEHILLDSPTQCVGSDLNGNGRRLVTHRSPMLSQQKAHNISDLRAFMAFIESTLGYTPSMRIEWKIDGVSCSIVYIDGQLVSASTRGDGLKGQDITDHIKVMVSVPRTIPQMGRVEVRGEVVCPKGQHISLGYKDERTAASAILNSSYSASAKVLKFVPWEVIADNFSAFSDMEKLGSWSFITAESYRANNIESIESVITNLVNNRNANYPVDGLVIKIDNYKDFVSMGANQHHPKGSIAYKFEAVSAVTTILNIEIKIAASGRRTPVAYIDPVILMGKKIVKVNLFSEKTMHTLGVVVGSSVKVILQNDVTPKIESVITNSVNTKESNCTPYGSSESFITLSEYVMSSEYWEQETEHQKAETLALLDKWEQSNKSNNNDQETINNSLDSSEPYITTSEDIMSDGYWEKETERLNAETLSILDKWEENKNANAIEPVELVITPEEEDVMPVGYWEREAERQKAESIRLLAQWREEREKELMLRPVYNHSSSNSVQKEADDCKNDSCDEDVIKTVDKTSNKLGKGFKIFAALAAIVAVIGLFAIGIGMAVFFTPLLAGAFTK